jgi:hypothetical protein
MAQEADHSKTSAAEDSTETAISQVAAGTVGSKQETGGVTMATRQEFRECHPKYRVEGGHFGLREEARGPWTARQAYPAVHLQLTFVEYGQ